MAPVCVTLKVFLCVFEHVNVGGVVKPHKGMFDLKVLNNRQLSYTKETHTYVSYIYPQRNKDIKNNLCLKSRAHTGRRRTQCKQKEREDRE